MSTMLMLAVAAIGGPAVPCVDVVEWNRTESGIEQIILWRFAEDGEQVAQWMHAKDVECIGNVVTWRSRPPEKLYVARCKIYRSSVTPEDPEVEDRKEHPVDSRIPYFD